ncbi:uncharacterized protein LTR77_005703 [Saxophila tyrrhenica]|uniref:Enoyl reductase (ER) domain-containing protein n=1 Tax=Saxophila tyrrhenica TaxID=1690608 RepID=A0AAV9PA10_9PEZI|nr:hypothetical protein LTR77_005703 [Saxophila tyrrhenica]
MSSIPKTMQAWRKHNGNPEPQLDTIPVPSVPDDGFLVKILAAGVCHSDVTILANDETRLPYYRDPFTIGHEGCGEIVAIGSSVPSGPEASQLKVGNRVAINPVAGCSDTSCPECGNGLPQLCQTEEGTHHGLGQDGSFAEFIAIHHRAALKVPDGVSPAAAAVATDAVMTSHHAIISRAKIRKEQTVFVFGLGGLGMNAVQILLGVGCRLFVTDVREGPIEEAVRLGVPRENVVPVGKGVQEWVRGKGWEGKIDVVVDFAGAQQTFSDAEVIVRRGGTILNVGLLEHSHKTSHVMNLIKAITVLYTFGGHSADIVAGMKMIADGTLTPQVETARMKDFPKVLNDLHEGRVKSRMVLIPQGVEAKL